MENTYNTQDYTRKIKKAGFQQDRVELIRLYTDLCSITMRAMQANVNAV